jgi:hypothetical protein
LISVSTVDLSDHMFWFMVSFDLGKYPNTTFFLDDLILSFSGVIVFCDMSLPFDRN